MHYITSRRHRGSVRTTMFFCALFILLMLQTCPALIQESYTCTATFADAGRRTPLSSNVIRHFENETVSNQNSNIR